MDWLVNVVYPISGGMIGGIVTIFLSDMKNDKTNKEKVSWTNRLKYSFISGVAGFVAVNLLNKTGSATEVIPLAIIAGLSPISYLKTQALTESDDDTNILVKDLEEQTEGLMTLQNPDEFKEKLNLDVGDVVEYEKEERNQLSLKKFTLDSGKVWKLKKIEPFIVLEDGSLRNLNPKDQEKGEDESGR